MGLLRVNVLGTPEVFHDERRLSFALRKAEVLPLYLAVEGGLQPRSKLAADSAGAAASPTSCQPSAERPRGAEWAVRCLVRQADELREAS